MDLTPLKDFGITIQTQPLLSDFTTFRLGGYCPALLTCQTEEQLEFTVWFLARKNLKFILIGSGSNLVVSDEGVDHYVIRYVSDVPLIERQGEDLIVSGSTMLDDLVQHAVKCSLAGLNDMSGIPGTVAGAVLGNAGAFGKQVGDVISVVYAFDHNGEKKELYPQDLGFTYRNSNLRQSRDIIASVRFSLTPGNRGELQNRRDEIIKLRQEKHPDMSVYPCAGSFFRNIEPTSKAGKREAAGWFLEEAGALRLSSGGAKVFEHHANMIYKSQGCRAQDVFDLSAQMAKAVKDKFNLDLVREVSFVGKFNGMPEDIQDIIW